MEPAACAAQSFLRRSACFRCRCFSNASRVAVGNEASIARLPSRGVLQIFTASSAMSPEVTVPVVADFAAASRGCAAAFCPALTPTVFSGVCGVAVDVAAGRGAVTGACGTAVAAAAAPAAAAAASAEAMAAAGAWLPVLLFVRPSSSEASVLELESESSLLALLLLPSQLLLALLLLVSASTSSASGPDSGVDPEAGSFCCVRRPRRKSNVVPLRVLAFWSFRRAFKVRLDPSAFDNGVDAGPSVLSVVFLARTLSAR